MACAIPCDLPYIPLIIFLVRHTYSYTYMYTYIILLSIKRFVNLLVFTFRHLVAFAASFRDAYSDSLLLARDTVRGLVPAFAALATAKSAMLPLMHNFSNLFYSFRSILRHTFMMTIRYRIYYCCTFTFINASKSMKFTLVGKVNLD